MLSRLWVVMIHTIFIGVKVQNCISFQSHLHSSYERACFIPSLETSRVSFTTLPPRTKLDANSGDQNADPKHAFSSMHENPMNASFPKHQSKEDKLRDFGVDPDELHKDQQHHSSPHFPCTIHAVAQEAFHAISNTLYNQHKPDPNIVSNAMAISPMDKRPVAFAYPPIGRDVGRIGIEIDGARYLSLSLDSLLQTSEEVEGVNSKHRSDSFIPSPDKRIMAKEDDRHLKKHVARNIDSSSFTTIERNREGLHQQVHKVESEAKTLRIISLIMAAKLSRKPWNDLEDDLHGLDMNQRTNASGRSVAIFFNTIRQALMASSELKLLQSVSSLKDTDDPLCYDNIRICCLGQDDIPDEMMKDKCDNGVTNNGKRKKSKMSRDLGKGVVDPSKGIVVIVQPTDYNSDSNPPSPSIGSLQYLQRILARASIHKLPTVIVSPRMIEQYAAFPNGSTDGGGYEQSGYQKSSTYGGFEPPR